MQVSSSESQKIINFIQEKEKRQVKYACSECKQKGQYCPDWVWGISAYDDEFKKLPLLQKLEYIRHIMPGRPAI